MSEETTLDLRGLNNISTEAYSEISQFCVSSIVKGKSATSSVPSENKEALALATLLTEASKFALNDASFASFVEDIGLSDTVAKLVSETYKTYRANLIFHMQGTAIPEARVVGCDWRIDYSIRSKDAGRDNEPVVFVTIKVMQDGKLKDVDMVCSREELLSFVATLRDGCKEVDRLIKTNQ